jgi:hypothetical protein
MTYALLCACTSLIESILHALSQVKQELQRMQEEYDACFGEPWGPLFKAGLYDSRFGKQVRFPTSV